MDEVKTFDSEADAVRYYTDKLEDLLLAEKLSSRPAVQALQNEVQQCRRLLAELNYYKAPIKVMDYEIVEHGGEKDESD